MTTSIIDTKPERQLSITDAEPRCVLCDRMWRPGDPAPIEHRFVLGVRPWITCHCDQDHHAATWHSFVVVNQRGIVAGGIICSSCAPDPGLDAALEVTARRTNAVVHGTN